MHITKALFYEDLRVVLRRDASARKNTLARIPEQACAPPAEGDANGRPPYVPHAGRQRVSAAR